MGCKECVHIDLCKKYHNQFAYDILPSVGCDDFKSKKPVTNADRIRAMTDEELRKAISVIVKFESCINPMCGNCDQCPLAGICDLLEEDVLEWLQQPAEGD